MARHTRGASATGTKVTSHAASGKNGVWTEEEDLLLATWQKKVGNKWSEVSKQIPGKTGQQCAQRWRHRVNPNIKRDKWDEYEDELLTRLVQQHGNHWATIARHVPGRTDQQCMGRWKRHLDPSIKRDKWTLYEDVKLCALYSKYDNAWSSISRALDGRTPQQCRTRWHNLKTTSFMSRNHQEIQMVDVDAIERAAQEKVDSGKRYHFAGFSSPAHEEATSEENWQHNIAANTDAMESSHNIQKKRKRGRPAKAVTLAATVEKGTRGRGRPRKHPSTLETPPNVIESRVVNIPLLDDHRDHQAKKRLCFDSSFEGFSEVPHREGQHPLKRTNHVEGLDFLNDHDDSWLAGYEAERLNSRPAYGEEPNDIDEGIMLPVNANTMLAMTPPKPKSKRQLLESQMLISKVPLYQNEESISGILGLEDMAGQEFAGSKTPLSALRHAPKTGFSPALVDLLRSPPMTHDRSHENVGFQGFGSPAGHHARYQHFQWNPSMTPSGHNVHQGVVRCLESDIEWARERSNKSDTLMPSTMNHASFTPGTVGLNPQLILDSTPRVATGSIMMKSNLDHSGEAPRYVTLNHAHPVDAGDSKLLPVKVLPAHQAPTKDLVPMSAEEHAFSQTCFHDLKESSLNEGLMGQDGQNDVLKTRTRRLSSASVRMCLHALLEKA
jgi:hypothetical protein